MTTDNYASGRRRFLVKTLGLTAAGLAVGGGGAWVKGRLEDGVVAEAAIGDLQSRLSAALAGKSEAELSLSTLHVQFAEVQDHLAAAMSQNAQLAVSLSEAQKETAALKMQLASTQGELQAAHDQLGTYRELTRLYDLLEGVNLDTLAQSGLTAVAGGLSATLGVVPLVREGLALSRDLLTGFEKTLPDFNDAMTWLGEQVIALRLGLYAVERAAQRTVNEMVSGLEATFGKFVNFVLDHLPFNIGENVRRTLSAIHALLTGLPGLTDGVNDRVLSKISKHVSDGPQNWRRTLVAPLREKALTPADQLLTSVAEAEATFTAALNDPVTAALVQRAALRDKIAAFRAAHHI